MQGLIPVITYDVSLYYYPYYHYCAALGIESLFNLVSLLILSRCDVGWQASNYVLFRQDLTLERGRYSSKDFFAS